MPGTWLSFDIVFGLVIGFTIGLLAAPLILSWLAWHEWSSASLEVDDLASEEADPMPKVRDG